MPLFSDTYIDLCDIWKLIDVWVNLLAIESFVYINFSMITCGVCVCVCVCVFIVYSVMSKSYLRQVNKNFCELKLVNIGMV